MYRQCPSQPPRCSHARTAIGERFHFPGEPHFLLRLHMPKMNRAAMTCVNVGTRDGSHDFLTRRLRTPWVRRGRSPSRRLSDWRPGREIVRVIRTRLDGDAKIGAASAPSSSIAQLDRQSAWRTADCSNLLAPDSCCTPGSVTRRSGLQQRSRWCGRIRRARMIFARPGVM